MYNRGNIMDIINEYQKEIDELKLQLLIITNESVKDAVKSKLMFLEDNMYRYKLQARAWGMEV